MTRKMTKNMIANLIVNEKIISNNSISLERPMRRNLFRKTSGGRGVRVVMSAAGALLLLSGIVVAQKENPSPAKKDAAVYAELAKVPKKAVDRHNPMESDPDAILAGGNLFEQHCAECHGDLAEGGKKGPSLRADEVQQATPGAIFWVLTNGVVRHGMPVWSKLPEPQRWQLVSYIKSLTPAAKPSVNGTAPPGTSSNESNSKPPGQ
jgi:mono/diheme cytochrome c family protein